MSQTKYELEEKCFFGIKIRALGIELFLHVMRIGGSNPMAMVLH